MNFWRLFLAVFFSSCQLFGCQSVTTEPDTLAKPYFSLETGRYIVYDVQENRYSLTSAPSQVNYQIKEVIGQSYTDVTGQTAYRLIRFRRTTEAQSWQADSVWSTRLDHNEFIRTENGRDFVQLLMPVSNQLSWNGNRLNELGSDTYTARNVGEPYSVQTKQFDQTVTVLGKHDSTLIAQSKYLAVYARQIGLIYRERINLQFCTASSACIGHNQIDYGTQQIYRLRDYGTQ